MIIIKITVTIFFFTLLKHKNRSPGINHPTTVLVESNAQTDQGYKLAQLIFITKIVFIFNLRVDFRSRLTMSSGLALGCGSPPSIISSKARLTLATFSSKTCACAESSKKVNKAWEMQHSIHRQLKGQAHIGHLLFKNLRMRGK